MAALKCLKTAHHCQVSEWMCEHKKDSTMQNLPWHGAKATAFPGSELNDIIIVHW